MKTTDPWIEKFPMDFIGDPNTALINYRARDTRTPYEQYEAGEKWIYVDNRKFFPDQNPYTISREGYYDRFLHPRHFEQNHYPYAKKNFKINFEEDEV